MRPLDDEPIDDNPMVIRVVAGCFALVASLWSVVFVGALGSKEPWPPPLYLLCVLMTVGYWYRAFAHLSLPWRTAIWGLSLLVQGGFAVGSIWLTLATGLWVNPLSCMCVTWWWTTAFFSAIFLLGEPEDLPLKSWNP